MTETGLIEAADQLVAGKEKWVDRAAERFHTDRYGIYLAIVLAAFFLFHTVKSIFVPIHVDEAYWWLLTKRPIQAAYYLHPLFKVVELWTSTHIFGDNTFAVRIGSNIFSTLSILLVFLISLKIFKDRRWAFLTALLVALLPLTNYWMPLGHQESVLTFFWLLTTYLVWRAVSEERKGFWYLAGISAGFGLINNMRSSFIFLSLLLFLATSRQARGWLRRKEPWLAFLIPVLMFTPSFLWYASQHFQPIIDQMNNHPGFLHHSIIGYLAFAGWHVLNEAFVFALFVYILSFFGLFYGGYLGYFDKRGKDMRFQFLVCLGAPMIIFFMITGGTPYWGWCGHLMLIIGGMGAFPILLSRSSKEWLHKYWKAGYVAMCLVVLVVTIPTIDLTQGDLIQNDWKALTIETEKAAATMPGEVYVASPTMFLPGQIAYYDYHTRAIAGYTQAFVVYEHPVWGSGNSHEAPWIPLEDLVGKNFIFIDVENNPDGYHTPVAYWEDKLAPYFDRVDQPEIYSYKKWFSDIRHYYIFKCYGFHGPDAAMDTKDVRQFVQGESST
jgi:hypothetical protein